MLAAPLVLLAACGDRSGEVPDLLVGLEPPPNILLMIVDDAGIDAFGCYPDLGIERPATPHIDALCQDGVVFDQAWSSPLCSPTRAGLYTGRHAYRHGQGQAVADEAYPMEAETTLLPDVLGRGGSGLTSALIGKWHLGTDLDGPNRMGFQHFSGGMGGDISDFYSYDKVVDGQTVAVENYATSETVDDASAWINGRAGPWFAVVSFNAAHTPFHLPPDDLHQQEGLTGDSSDINRNTDAYFRAMIEAMDTEIGRLFDEIGPSALQETVIVFMGDNGSMGATMQGLLPNSQAKSTLYQGGVHVPLIIAGVGVEGGGRRVEHMVSTMDLHATILELASVPTEALGEADYDSVSLLPLLQDPQAGPIHELLLVETFGTRVKDDYQGRAVRDQRYKLIDIELGDQHLFDLQADPLESVDLLASGELDAQARASYETLAAYLATLPELPPDK
jgi:arylsulfatase B